MCGHHVMANRRRITTVKGATRGWRVACHCGWESPTVADRASADLALYHHWKDSRVKIPDQAKGVTKRA